MGHQNGDFCICKHRQCSFDLEKDILLATKLLNSIIITEKQTSFPVVVQNSQVSALEHPQSP